MAPRGQNNVGELLHFVATRMRVTGEPTVPLRQYLRSLDSVRWVELPNTTLAWATNREPTTLANFIEQRSQLEIRVTAFGGYFSISKIVVFNKPVATGYPQ